MIPVDVKGEATLFEIENILIDLLNEYRGKTITHTNLLALQMNLNELTIKYLPIVVEVDGELKALVGYSTRFREEDSKMLFIAKVRDDSELVTDYFRRKAVLK